MCGGATVAINSAEQAQSSASTEERPWIAMARLAARASIENACIVPHNPALMHATLGTRIPIAPLR